MDMTVSIIRRQAKCQYGDGKVAVAEVSKTGTNATPMCGEHLHRSCDRLLDRR